VDVSAATRGNGSFTGVCHSFLYLGELHRVLARPNVGKHGRLMLIDGRGFVIATSRAQDAAGGVGSPARYDHVCNFTDFPVACAQWRVAQAIDPVGFTSRELHGQRGRAHGSMPLHASLNDHQDKDGGVVVVDQRKAGQDQHTFFKVNARAFRCYLSLVGRVSDFDGGIRDDRNGAVGVAVAVFVVAAVTVALVTSCFTRPLRAVTEVLSELARVTGEHASKLEQGSTMHSMAAAVTGSTTTSAAFTTATTASGSQGDVNDTAVQSGTPAMSAVPETQWRRIIEAMDGHSARSSPRDIVGAVSTSDPQDLLHPALASADQPNHVQRGAAAAAPSGLCGCDRGIDRALLKRWGGPEIRNLQTSLVNVVSSLCRLGQRASEREMLRRRFIRYIFHEV